MPQDCTEAVKLVHYLTAQTYIILAYIIMGINWRLCTRAWLASTADESANYTL